MGRSMASVDQLVVFLGILVLVSGIARSEPDPEPSSPLESAEFMKEVKQECRNTTGDDKAFRDLVEVMQNDTPRCFMQYVNMSYLQTSVDGFSKAEQAKLLGDICGQLEKAVVCIEPVVNKIKPCIDDEDDMQILKRIVDTIPEALKMICKNSGAMLLELREPLSRSCAVELAPAIDDCMDVISNSTMMTDLKGYTFKECKEIKKMKDCFNQRITECGAVVYLNLFSLFYRNLVSLTPCLSGE